MSVQYKVGAKLKSAVCDAQVILLRGPARPIDLRIGGAVPLIDGQSKPEGLALDPAWAGGCLTGKRYTDAEETIELLCTKGGQGGISMDGLALGIKQAKQLPSSD
jgi:hypothetical protein